MEKQQLERWPFFLVLLPVYYLTHLLVDYYGLLSFSDLLDFYTFAYLGIPVLLFIICCFSLGRKITFSIFLLELFFFFFSIIKDIANALHPSLGRYSVILPAIALIFIILTIYLFRSKKTFIRLNLYFNMLFIILILVDVFLLFSNPESKNEKVVAKQNLEIGKTLKHCNDCERPDIYFIIFDSHSGLSVVKSLFNYDNSLLDDSLRQKGFFVAKNSTSNYNSTAYSVSATLQMDYHKAGVPKQVETLDFFKAEQLINANPLCTFLKREGYIIINYSIFPLLKEKSQTPAFKLIDAESILQSQTFWYYFKHDIAWNFNWFTKTSESEKQKLSKEALRTTNILRIQKTIEGIKKTSAEPHTQPVFLYAHILLPHAPYLFDSLGNTLSSHWLNSHIEKDKYIQQLIYSRKIIDDLSNTLQQEAKRPRIIIIQGDHGYQFYPEFGKQSPLNKYSFSNLNAIYFPDKDYSLLYDSISSVNTFRVILKKYFKQDIKPVKDSSYFSTTK